MDDSDNPLFVTALAKGLRVISAFVPGHAEMTLSELADVTGLNKSTTQRAAFTLEALGYLAKDPHSKRLRLTPASLQVGAGYLQVGELIERANPYLHELNRDTGESCNLLEPVDHSMVYVARFASHKQISIHIPLGQRLPIYCTAAGRAFLSALPKAEAAALLAGSARIAMTRNTVTDLDALIAVTRQAHVDGFATSNEEVYVGDIAVAAPIVNADGRPLGAINIAVPFSRWTLADATARLAPLVVNTARSISNAARSIRGA
ncbi:IclR family transcriptional regulator [Paracoccus shanxieyensis]|uniref:Helix-turn-helix domain-containing protein n=1 Tax=Paracoccus shanxieyensis TaxID=2675752 RepID=A0A6L6IZK8_9RHOB|nr:IclR family transcriptional regulator [Paracoccus shanxieyensis]MTH64004.1 helix-turn-helix domain-containing protein [Paracoccus shanxieyensis]MTH86955.1 helix-turn-helix domain-containing protein [Paracoccus shanxieyensis]